MKERLRFLLLFMTLISTRAFAGDLELYDPTSHRESEHLPENESSSPPTIVIITAPDAAPDAAPASFRRVSIGHGGQKSQPPLRRKAGQPPAGLLLSEAQAAFRAQQDYVGVAVLPVSNTTARESQLPWVVRNRDIVKSGQDR